MATPSDKYLGGELTPTQSAAVAALTSSPVVTDSTGLVAGNLIRQSSAGVWVKAQADTTAHAGVTHVWNGSQPIPLNLYSGVIVFDSLPVLGPYWLSAGTAGVGTSTAPSFLLLRVCCGVVVEVVTTSAPYTARVSNFAAAVPQMNLLDHLIEDTCNSLAVTPDQMCIHWNDCGPGDFTEATGSATDVLIPREGRIQIGGFKASQNPSCIAVGASNTNWWSAGKWPWKSVHPYSCKTRIAIRKKATGVAGKFSITGCEPTTNDGKYCSFFGGNFYGGAALYNHLYFATLTDTHNILNTVADDLTDLGVNDGGFHLFEWEFSGDGRLRTRFDAGTFSAYKTMPNNCSARSPMAFIQASTETNTEIDYVFIATER